MFRLRTYCLLTFALVVSTFALGHTDNRDLDAAIKGDSAAQLRLAKAYQFGEGQPRDIREALRWFQAAAAQGNSEAAYTMGVLAYNGKTLGDDVEQSDISAWVWFRVAQEEGYPDAAEAVLHSEDELSKIKLVGAHERLAALFINGKVAPANPSAAARELQWLEDNESSQGMLLLGRFYLEGSGVPKDIDKAQSLCEKAARQDLAGAQYCLSLVYDEKGDRKSAFEALKKDAAFGFPQATLALVGRYHEGVGTTADPVMALAWAITAERGRLIKGAELRQKISAELTVKQQKEAAKKAELLKTPVISQPRLLEKKK
jgi:uncharacterized protein